MPLSSNVRDNLTIIPPSPTLRYTSTPTVTTTLPPATTTPPPIPTTIPPCPVDPYEDPDCNILQEVLQLHSPDLNILLEILQSDSPNSNILQDIAIRFAG